MPASRRPFRILSLSGGGVRGIYQAAFLQRLAPVLPSPFESNFDMIAGTSTGSIIAAALTFNVALEEIRKFYEEEARVIFDRRLMSNIVPGPHYQQEPLRNVLQRIFSDACLRDREAPILLVPATTLEKFGPRVFWNVNAPPGNSDLGLKVVDILLASCAAPTYFPPVTPAGDASTYVDGGIWANSPCLIAAIYAHSFLGVPFGDMRILSVGNGTSAKGALAAHFKERVPKDPRNIKSILEMLFETQVSSAENIASYLVGEKNLMSIEDHTPGVIELDDVDASLTLLPGLAERHANRHIVKLTEFLNPTPPEVDEETPGAEIMKAQTSPPSPGVSGGLPEDPLAVPWWKKLPIKRDRYEAEVILAYVNGKFEWVPKETTEGKILVLDHMGGLIDIKLDTKLFDCSAEAFILKKVDLTAQFVPNPTEIDGLSDSKAGVKQPFVPKIRGDGGGGTSGGGGLPGGGSPF